MSVRPSVLVSDGTSRSARVLARASGAARHFGRAIWRGVVDFYQSENLTFAASIADHSLLSLFPFLLLIFTILSRVAVERGNVLPLIARALPSDFDFLVERIKELAGAPFQLSVANTLVMIWASMGVFGAITSAVNHAWGVEKPPGYFKHKLISFVMLMASGLLLVLTLLLVSALEFAESRWFPAVVSHYPSVAALTNFVYRNAPTPMFIVVVGLIYYFVPNAKVRLRDVWLGAILAGVLWHLAFNGFAWYVRLSRFSVHGGVATVVVFLVWIYLCAVILLYGVEVTAAYARLRKHLPQEAPAAAARET